MSSNQLSGCVYSPILFITIISGLTLPCSADGVTNNWGGNFTPCERHSELLRWDSMSLGVKMSTLDRKAEDEFEAALNFWSKIIDMTWHKDETSSCAIQLVEGTHAILTGSVVARSQFPQWDNFQGWIAFDPHAPLTKPEMYAVAVHEIGHLLGLKHNPNPRSVMYYLNLEGQEIVDQWDLKQLAIHHKLRFGSADAALTLAKRGSGD